MMRLSALLMSALVLLCLLAAVPTDATTVKTIKEDCAKPPQGGSGKGSSPPPSKGGNPPGPSKGANPPGPPAGGNPPGPPKGGNPPGPPAGGNPPGPPKGGNPPGGKDCDQGSTGSSPAGSNQPTAPVPVPVQESSTGVAVGSCPYSQVYLNQLGLSLTLPGGMIQDLNLNPPFNPTGPWRYITYYETDALGGATINFTPGNWTNGATFRVRFNHGDYIYVSNPGTTVQYPLAAGDTNLIEFDVIQAPCAGTDIQEYAITLYPPCPYTPVYLNQLDLALTLSDGTVQDLSLNPPFNPTGPWRYIAYYGPNPLSGAQIDFTPGNWTNGATFRVRFNHGDFVYVNNPGTLVQSALLAGSNLIEFDVIQAPCAGTDIQEYAITLYQESAPTNSTGSD